MLCKKALIGLGGILCRFASGTFLIFRLSESLIKKAIGILSHMFYVISRSVRWLLLHQLILVAQGQ